MPRLDATRTVLDWLRRGWDDLTDDPGPSLACGALAFAVSMLLVGALLFADARRLLLPMLAGFVIFGPLLATGLYHKSRMRERGVRVGIAEMLLVRPCSGPQSLLLGVLLLAVLLNWLAAAALLERAFLGPVASVGAMFDALLFTPAGWALLAVGTVMGGVFAAVAFAIGAFSAPLLLVERRDAVSAALASIRLVWRGRPATFLWAATVLLLFLLSVATCFIGLVVAFPLLGHAAWHALRDLRPDPRERVLLSRRLP